MTIEICIGSSCHIKGAYDVIENLKKLIEEHKVQSKIELKACFCMGNCGDGVSVRVDGTNPKWIKPETCYPFFQAILLDLNNERREITDELNKIK